MVKRLIVDLYLFVSNSEADGRQPKGMTTIPYISVAICG